MVYLNILTLVMKIKNGHVHNEGRRSDQRWDQNVRPSTLQFMDTQVQQMQMYVKNIFIFFLHCIIPYTIVLMDIRQFNVIFR